MSAGVLALDFVWAFNSLEFMGTPFMISSILVSVDKVVVSVIVEEVSSGVCLIEEGFPRMSNKSSSMTYLNLVITSSRVKKTRVTIGLLYAPS